MLIQSERLPSAGAIARREVVRVDPVWNHLVDGDAVAAAQFFGGPLRDAHGDRPASAERLHRAGANDPPKPLTRRYEASRGIGITDHRPVEDVYARYRSRAAPSQKAVADH